MVKLRLYLDTSVFSAYHDDRAPERREQTRAFWARLPEFEVATSEAARREVGDVREASRRQTLLTLVETVTVHPVTEEAEALARQYVEAGVFTKAMIDDARHVAAAVLTRQDILVSWNFRHLVNRRRRARVNEANASFGLPAIEILAPPEV